MVAESEFDDLLPELSVEPEFAPDVLSEDPEVRTDEELDDSPVDVAGELLAPEVSLAPEVPGASCGDGDVELDDADDDVSVVGYFEVDVPVALGLGVAAACDDVGAALVADVAVGADWVGVTADEGTGAAVSRGWTGVWTTEGSGACVRVGASTGGATTTGASTVGATTTGGAVTAGTCAAVGCAAVCAGVTTGTGTTTVVVGSVPGAANAGAIPPVSAVSEITIPDARTAQTVR